MYNPISFPGLDFTVDPNPELFKIFGLSVRWYGLLIALGFLLAAVYVLRRAPKLGISQDHLLDALIIATPVAIVFARLYYIVFSWSEFNGDLGKMINIRNGGLAIYGAVIGATLAAAVYTRVKRVSLGALLDVVAPALLIGQAIGRWGNFFNREAFGTETTLPWRMEIFVWEANGVAVNQRMAVHPTFLYESLWALLGFLVLHMWTKRRKFKGEIFCGYVAWYGLGRAFIEGLRTDSLYLFGSDLRVSQFVGIASCLIALAVLFYQRLFREHEPEELLQTALPPRKGKASVRDGAVVSGADDVTNDANGEEGSHDGAEDETQDPREPESVPEADEEENESDDSAQEDKEQEDTADDAD